MSIALRSGTRVVFTGDSVTDQHRLDSDSGLGSGYVQAVAGRWGLEHPETRAVWINTGIAGDTLAGLAGRFERDVLGADPDVVSILIGINDCGYRFSQGHDEVRPAQFRQAYRQMLQPLIGGEHRRGEEEGVEIVLVEPFLLPVSRDQEEWLPDLDGKIEVVRDLAREIGAHLVEAHTILTELAATTGPQYWAADGVHPTPAGHHALARAWSEVLS